MDDEAAAMELIVQAGDARSCAMEAIAKAKTGDFSVAGEKLKAGREAMSRAHVQQTEILEQSMENTDFKISMIMVHAQDHLMNALTILDLAQEFCDIFEIIRRKS
ncbi:PTS cellobiose transporter subunit IIA [Spirochaetia bacterium]|nr:PTS cellobiose transporter subunit IIA [Spirochaetia bacterium]